MELVLNLFEIGTALSGATGILIVLILSFINIPKINLNIWELIGKNMTKNVSDKIDSIDTRISDVEKKLDSHILRNEEDEIKEARRRILSFNDALVSGKIPTKEHEEEILMDIDMYEDYCVEHPTFPNNRAVISINNIKSDYSSRLLNKNFAL